MACLSRVRYNLRVAMYYALMLKFNLRLSTY